jgi:hypothetical protein
MICAGTATLGSRARYYVGYRVGELEVGLNPNSKVGPIAYTDVEDIKSSLRAIIEVGAEIVQDVRALTVMLLR